MDNSWKYYNHALIPATEPHIECTPPKKNKRTFWKTGGGTAMLARWTTNWDCEYETNWWYVIKDTPFDISTLKSKRRYEINKGKKNFTVKRINPMDYQDEMVEVTKSAYSSWPVKYRTTVDEIQFKQGLIAWKNNIVYGGFDNEDGQLCAYSYCTEYLEHLEFSVLRACPESEKKGINAAMVVTIVEDYNDRLGKNFYINDGARSIRHETAFQDYLEKYFGFRKAYCKMHIKYRFPLGVMVRVLYPFRKYFKSETNIGSQICAIFKMEEISRNV